MVDWVGIITKEKVYEMLKRALNTETSLNVS